MRGIPVLSTILASSLVLSLSTAFAATDTAKHSATPPKNKIQKESKVQSQKGLWIGSWEASQIKPFDSGISHDGFNNQTVRMIIHPHASGSQIRLRFSNVYGSQRLTFSKVNVAIAGEGAKTVQGTSHIVTFGGKTKVTIPVGKEMFSDPIPFLVKTGDNLAVSVYVPENSGPTTWHAVSNQTTYYSTQGDQTSKNAATSFTHTADSWFWISGLDVLTKNKKARVIVTLGDSITDGDRSTLNANHRYPDYLANRLQSEFPNQAVSVLDAGISGNRILQDLPMNGVRALDRLNRDVFSQTGVTDVILLEGINDIAKSPHNYDANQIVEGMKEIATQAHQKGLHIYVGTLTPFRDAAYPQYDWTFTEQGDKTRQQINGWIRSTNVFDGVIDYEKAVADPTDPDKMLPAYDSGDHIHPGDSGYKAMADAIDLSVFKPTAKKHE